MMIKQIVFITFSLFWIACGNDGEDNNVNEGEQDNGDLVLEYEPATTDRGQALEKVFKEAKIFEAILEVVNSEYAFPKDIPVRLAECGFTNAFWYPMEGAIYMCYEMFDYVLSTYKNGTNWTNEEIAEAGIGTYIWIFYHEMGHMMTEIYDLPVTGNEEDAVDQMATILFIDGEGQDYVLTAAIFWQLVDSGDVAPPDLADEHALNLQRYYNTLCLLYGSDPQEYIDFENLFPEMVDRLPRCETEYAKIGESWRTLLQPWTK